MEIAMMEGAEGNDIFVADFLAQAAPLGEAEMVGMGWLTIADEAGELSNPPQMIFVADPAL
jgi:hypothetical protein